MTMHRLLEQDCAVAVDLDLDIVPDETSIDLAAALIAEAGRIEPAMSDEQAEVVSSGGSPVVIRGSRFTVDDLAQHRPALVRFARRKVRDEALAEDAVQDAMLAAVANRARFQGQSSLRTWLIGILDHKIQDVFRRENRYVAISGEDDEQDPFDPLGLDGADESADPMQAVASARMRAALEREIEEMPPNLKDVFRMQALEGMATVEVCKQLSISEANCWVRLHRARKHLAARMRDHLV
jgi:RNA polymerase sigma-70 factor (ECF subfamily)